jgi:hypothetical protein
MADYPVLPIFMIMPRLFKYVSASVALTILKNKTLRWRSPKSFNDPFELKNPLEFGFEWNELKEAYHRCVIAVLSQVDDPPIVEGNPVASIVREARSQCRNGRRDPETIWKGMEIQFEGFVNQQKELTLADRNTWNEMKQNYRILCLSAVHDNILMWSHYADEHRGIVLEFRPTIGQPAGSLPAAVSYSNEVPVAVTLEEYVRFLTGIGHRPDSRNAWKKSIYTKSSVWVYENESRILDTKRADEQGEFSDRQFDPQDLLSVFLGCRIASELCSQIRAILADWTSPVAIFKMRDERIRFELSPERV